MLPWQADVKPGRRSMCSHALKQQDLVTVFGDLDHFLHSETFKYTAGFISTHGGEVCVLLLSVRTAWTTLYHAGLQTFVLT